MIVKKSLLMFACLYNETGIYDSKKKSINVCMLIQRDSIRILSLAILKLHVQ